MLLTEKLITFKPKLVKFKQWTGYWRVWFFAAMRGFYSKIWGFRSMDA